MLLFVVEIEETEEEKSFSVGSLKEKYIKEERRRFLKVPPLITVNKQTLGGRRFAYYYSAVAVNSDMQ
jgi:hypothetical protein